MKPEIPKILKPRKILSSKDRAQASIVLENLALDVSDALRLINGLYIASRNSRNRSMKAARS